MLLDLKEIHLLLGGVPILNGVSLHIEAGEIYGLLGPNGAGKSTTIAAALGLLPIASGARRLFGRDPGEPEGENLRADVGVMPEQNGLYEWMTAETYLQLFADLYQVNVTPNDIASSLRQVGLAANTGYPMSTYSRGMKQRLTLARALINHPRLLVLDEPTNGLDPRGRRQIHDIFLKLADAGASILLCTHLLDDVERLCSRVGFISEGRTLAEGNINELLAQQGHSRRYRIRLANTSKKQTSYEGAPFRIRHQEGDWLFVELGKNRQPAEVWQQAFADGWKITEIRHVGGGLEDLYLNLTSQTSEQDRRAA